MRSRLLARQKEWRASGIISACAEQTLGGYEDMAHFRDHLRVCGADQTKEKAWSDGWGSSPRVRSRQL